MPVIKDIEDPPCSMRVIKWLKLLLVWLVIVRTITRNTSQKEGPSSAITTQKDSMVIYRRKRAPRKVRRRARRRYQGFLRKQLIASNDNTNLYQLTGNSLSSETGQGFSSITFGYLRTGSTINDDVGDWYESYQNYLNANPVFTSKRFYVTGLSYDISFTNRTADTGNTEAIAIELDVYEFVVRKDKQFDAPNIAAFMTDSLDNEQQLPGASAKMASSDLGVTPFDMNQALKYIVIKNKQRYYIPRGETISFVRNVKFKRPVQLTSEDFFNASLTTSAVTMRSGLTRGLLLVQKGTLTQDLSTNNPGITNLSYNVQARYRFKVIDKDPNQNAVGT